MASGGAELSPGELELMKVLWSAGRLSAREVHERVEEATGWAYSTTRTMLERLVGKGTLAKEPFHGLNLYRPRLSRPAGLARLVRDFAARVLEVEPAAVVPLFADGGTLSDAEIAELERLLSTDEVGGARDRGGDDVLGEGEP